MTSIYEMSASARLIAIILIILITISSLVLFLMHFIDKRKISIKILSLFTVLFGNVFFEYIRNVHLYLPYIKNEYIRKFCIRLYDLPAFTVFIMIAVMGYALYLIIADEVKWNMSHITPVSVKESFDALSTGICCYHDDGMPVLINSAMNDIYFELTGTYLRSGTDFLEILKSGTIAEGNQIISNDGKNVIRLKNGNVYMFDVTKVKCKDTLLNELLAVDITEEYEKSLLLSQKREKMIEINKRLKEYSNKVVELNIEREIFSAKTKLHDDLGHALIASRSYLKTKSGDKKALTYLWKKNISLLKDEKDGEMTDDYTAIFDIAEYSGIKIETNGILPQSKIAKSIVYFTLSECLTNTCRHARGDLIRIETAQNEKYYSLEFTNNGIQPVSEIKEGGGLSAVRKIVEENGGKFSIQSTPFFSLSISIPMFPL